MAGLIGRRLVARVRVGNGDLMLKGAAASLVEELGVSSREEVSPFVEEEDGLSVVLGGCEVSVVTVLLDLGTR